MYRCWRLQGRMLTIFLLYPTGYIEEFEEIVSCCDFAEQTSPELTLRFSTRTTTARARSSSSSTAASTRPVSSPPASTSRFVELSRPFASRAELTLSPFARPQLSQIESWVNLLLPARSFGYIILTTSAGIMDHEEARRKHVAGKILGASFASPALSLRTSLTSLTLNRIRLLNASKVVVEGAGPLLGFRRWAFEVGRKIGRRRPGLSLCHKTAQCDLIASLKPSVLYLSFISYTSWPRVRATGEASSSPPLSRRFDWRGSKLLKGVSSGIVLRLCSAIALSAPQADSHDVNRRRLESAAEPSSNRRFAFDPSLLVSHHYDYTPNVKL